MEMDCGSDSSQGYLALPSFHYYPLPLSDEDLLNGTTPTLPSNIISKVSTPQPRSNRVKRPHTKSRRGCFNCKIRRIKCQETKPSCENCIHKDLGCVYPTEGDRTQTWMQRQSQSQSVTRGETSSLSLAASRRISTTPFTGDDLRFWHHFLVDARPHLPFGNEELWLTDIPAFAHNCPALLHAILALGASHCSLIIPQGSQYAPVAIAHRGKALKALRTILAKGDNCTVAEMDGALATCYTLTSQAHHMSDGVVDFAVMVRGCCLVTAWYFQKSRESNVFKVLQSHEQTLEMITSWLPGEPRQIKDRETIEACIASLAQLQPFLRSPAHYAFYNTLRLAYESLLISYRHAFRQLSLIYMAWGAMDNIEFLTFIAPGNHVSRALFMHYIAIDSFMRAIHVETARTRNLRVSGGCFLIYRWAEAVFGGLPESMQELVQVLLKYLAVDLLPALGVHRTLPQWNHELTGFIDWLRRRLPSEELYKIS